MTAGGGRFRFASGVMLAVWTVLLLFLAYVQLVRWRHYKREAELQHWSRIELPPRRGEVRDREGRTLSRSRSSCSIQLLPQYAACKETLAAVLSRFGLGEAREIRRELSSHKSLFWFRRHIDYRTGDAMRRMLVKRQYHNCTYVSDDFARDYPFRERCADVIGFVGDGRGRAGLEAEYDSVLRGEAGWALLLRDGVGERFVHPSLPKQEPLAGGDLYLTLDLDVQAICQDALAEVVDRTGALSGSVVVLDARNGAVLALTDYPAYDPSSAGAVPRDRLKLAAVSDQFEPGSSFKLLVCAAALESPDSYRLMHQRYDVSLGFVQIGGRKIHDVHKDGVLGFADLFVKSSNVGCAMLSTQIEPRAFYELARGLGFGSMTGLGLPNEGAGYLDVPKRLTPLRFANVVFGQGVVVTLAQLAAAYLCVANDGVYMKPYLIDSVKQDGRVVRRNSATRVRRVLRPANCRIIKDILERVVTEGTGILAQVDGVPTCGKTGTAQKVEPWGGYSRTRSRMTFVGFFPKTEPEFVVAVLVDEPRTERFAGSAACPVFKTVGEGLVKWVRAGKRRALLESGRLAAQTGPAGQSLNLVCPTSFARYVTPE